MRISKLGIEIPESGDEYHCYGEALHMLWKMCVQLSDALDSLQDEIDKLKERGTNQ